MLEGKTKIIAVCSAGIDTDYNDELLRALYAKADETGVKLLFFHSFSYLYYFTKHDVGESNIYHLINYHLIDGIIMLSETIKNDAVRDDIIKEAQIYEIPVVSIDHYIEGCYNITFRYDKALEAMVTHLVEHHHCRRINFIAGLRENAFSEERVEAYRKVLTKYGIPIEEERIGYGEFWSVPTKRVIDDFIQSELPFPDAIVCANDAMAIASCKYLTEAGYRVPEDVAVTGFDGILEAREHIPRITTARNDYVETVCQAFQMIKNHLEHKRQPKQIFVDAVPMIGASCGCKCDDGRQSSNELTRRLYERLDEYDNFNMIQIAMASDLTDNDSFQGIFDNLMKYSDNFFSDNFWLCIVDDFLIQKETLSDIIEESSKVRGGYSSKMDAMLSKNNGEWQGITDFNTASLLPQLDAVLKVENNIMFFPLHVLEHTIGYVALGYDPDKMKMPYLYQFLMNISNALETTRIHQRQKTIINNLEIKYIHDPMTGLFNRRGFYQSLEPAYESCIREKQRLMVISVDLNGLKPINDTYGHADGDIAIATVGRALSEAASGKYTCARFGGDEFVVAGRIAADEEMEAFCRKVREYLEEFNAHSDKPYQVSASIGCIIGVPNGEISLDEFIKVADEKMYEDKVRYHLQRK